MLSVLHREGICFLFPCSVSHSSGAVSRALQGNPPCAAFSSLVCGAGRRITSQLLKAFQLPVCPLRLSVCCFRTSSANANPSEPNRLLRRCLLCLGCSVPAPSLEGQCVTNVSLPWSPHTLCIVFRGGSGLVLGLPASLGAALLVQRSPERTQDILQQP